ncbi:hypothetical protein, partial [Pseudomonas viridiflava]|uniref:hypothetical protein n=1 Tax=Pseudomonas viridiflava TaxID=33069 RepID=UPI00197DEB32
ITPVTTLKRLTRLTGKRETPPRVDTFNQQNPSGQAEGPVQICRRIEVRKSLLKKTRIMTGNRSPSRVEALVGYTDLGRSFLCRARHLYGAYRQPAGINDRPRRRVAMQGKT